MRLNQYVVSIPMETFRKVFNISDTITDISPAPYRSVDTLSILIQSDKALKTIAGKTIPEVELKKIQKPKRKVKK